jgi:pimeloyl-ACP methyl ester carboxylesterase
VRKTLFGGWNFLLFLVLFAVPARGAHAGANGGLGLGTEATNSTAAETWKWPVSSATGVALVLHGLNLKPEKMDGIANTLAERGVIVLRGSLTGHIDEREPLFSVTPEKLISDCLALYTAARDTSQRFGVPLYFVGYSFGSLVALDLMERYRHVRFDRLVLFAPALTPRPLTHAVVLLGKRRLVPSRTPADYRMHDGVPAAAYQAMFRMISHLKESGYGDVNQPAIVFIDSEDELLSYRALLDLTRLHLNLWRVVTVSTGRSRNDVSYHHLIIDEDSVGTEQWRLIQKEMNGFLDSSNTVK